MVAVLGVRLVVLMGQNCCGAVKAGMSVVSDNALYPGVIGNMIEPIIPAVLETRNQSGAATEIAVRQNVRRVVRKLREASDPLLIEPQRAGKVRMVGAYHKLDSGGSICSTCHDAPLVPIRLVTPIAVRLHPSGPDNIPRSGPTPRRSCLANAFRTHASDDRSDCSLAGRVNDNVIFSAVRTG